jgi:hypothetical protein
MAWEAAEDFAFRPDAEREQRSYSRRSRIGRVAYVGRRMKSSLSKHWRGMRQDLRRRLAMHFVSDRDYLARLYHDKLGAWPDLEHPAGFNEKILCKMLRDRRPLLTLFSDKLRVRDYVRRVAPGLALPTLYWWSSQVDSLPFDALPREFVLKANHGSGWNYLVENKAEVRAADLVRLARRWLKSDFTIVGREWAYRDIRRAVYAEQLLRGSEDAVPPDYKLFVFGGRLRLIQVDRDRFTRHTQVLYDRHWRYIDGTVAALQGTPIEPPQSLSLMIESAEALSSKVDFVRVDLYEIDGRAHFGELTSSPNKGLSPFRPRSLDHLLGEWLVPDDYSQPGTLRYDADAFAEIGTIAAMG